METMIWHAVDMATRIVSWNFTGEETNLIGLIARAAQWMS
jgi:hypothetical protein